MNQENRMANVAVTLIGLLGYSGSESEMEAEEKLSHSISSITSEKPHASVLSSSESAV